MLEAGRSSPARGGHKYDPVKKYTNFVLIKTEYVKFLSPYCCFASEHKELSLLQAGKLFLSSSAVFFCPVPVSFPFPSLPFSPTVTLLDRLSYISPSLALSDPRAIDRQLHLSVTTEHSPQLRLPCRVQLYFCLHDCQWHLYLFSVLRSFRPHSAWGRMSTGLRVQMNRISL